MQNMQKRITALFVRPQMLQKIFSEIPNHYRAQMRSLSQMQ